MKNPYATFFWRDWQADSKLRMCSVGARGLWMELLCIMAQNDEQFGHLSHHGQPIAGQVLCRMIGCTDQELASMQVELVAAGVPDIDANGVWSSRRLIRDEIARVNGQKNGKRGGNPALTPKSESNTIPNTITITRETLTGGVNPPVNPVVNQIESQSHTATNFAINPPSLQDCINQAATIGMRQKDVEAFFNYYDSVGWKRGNGALIVNLKSALTTWKNNQAKYDAGKGAKGVDTSDMTPEEAYRAKGRAVWLANGGSPAEIPKEYREPAS